MIKSRHEISGQDLAVNMRLLSTSGARGGPSGDSGVALRKLSRTSGSSQGHEEALHDMRKPTSGIPSMTCPLAITRAGTPVAAMAEQMAYLAERKSVQDILTERRECGDLSQLTCYIKVIKNTDQMWLFIIQKLHPIAAPPPPTSSGPRRPSCATSSTAWSGRTCGRRGTCSRRRPGQTWEMEVGTE